MAVAGARSRVERVSAALNGFQHPECHNFTRRASVYDRNREDHVALWQDLRYGCRMLAASPGFTIVAVLSLAIGIGANCAIFSFADALLLRPLPVARPGEVSPSARRSSLEAFGASSLVSSYRDYVDIRDRSKSFDGLAAFQYLTVGIRAESQRDTQAQDGHAGQRQPAAADGRRADHRPRRSGPTRIRWPAATRSWCSAGRCGSRNSGRIAAVLGRSVRINGVQFTVIGVAPESFTGMNTFVRSDFFVPLMMSPRADQRSAGRLARGARRAEPAPQRTAQGRRHAGAGPERVDGDRRRPRARVSGHEQEPAVLRATPSCRRGSREDPPDAKLVAMLVDARARRAARRVRETSRGC